MRLLLTLPAVTPKLLPSAAVLAASEVEGHNRFAAQIAPVQCVVLGDDLTQASAEWAFADGATASGGYGLFFGLRG